MTEPITPSGIDDFVSSFKSQGYHLNSRYTIEFTYFPPIFKQAVRQNFGSERDFASLVAKRAVQVNSPTISLSTSDLKITNVDYQAPYQRNYEGNLSINFLADKENKLRNTFVNWIEGISNPFVGAYNYRINYTTNLLISQIDNAGKLSRSYLVREVFPRSVDGIPYNAVAEAGALSEFRIELSFKDFVVNPQVVPTGEPPPPAPPPQPPAPWLPAQSLEDVDRIAGDWGPDPDDVSPFIARPDDLNNPPNIFGL